MSLTSSINDVDAVLWRISPRHSWHFLADDQHGDEPRWSYCGIVKSRFTEAGNQDELSGSVCPRCFSGRFE